MESTELQILLTRQAFFKFRVDVWLLKIVLIQSASAGLRPAFTYSSGTGAQNEFAVDASHNLKQEFSKVQSKTGNLA